MSARTFMHLMAGLAFAATAASLAAAPTSGPASAPATSSAPADDAGHARELLEAGKASMAAKDWPKAIEQLEQAVGADASLLEAHFLLAKAQAAAGAPGLAVAQFARLRQAVQSHRDGAEASAWKGRADREVAALWPNMRAWDRMRHDMAAKARKLAADSASPSSADALAMAAALLPEDEQLAAEARGAREGMAWKPASAPASMPTTAAVGSLLRKAADLSRRGSHAEAVVALQEAASCRSPEILAALAEEYLAAKLPVDAAAVAGDGLREVRFPDRPASKAFRGRFEAVLHKADASHARLDAIAGQFLACAEALAATTAAAKDFGTLHCIVEAMAAISPQRPCVWRYRDLIAGRSVQPWMADPNKWSVGKWGLITDLADDSRLTRHGMTTELKVTRLKEMAYGFGATLTPVLDGRKVYNRKSFRVACRVEILSPDSAATSGRVRLTANGVTTVTFDYAKRAVYASAGSNGWQADAAVQGAAFNPAGQYLVIVEKNCDERRVYVDGELISRGRLPTEGLAMAEKAQTYLNPSGDVPVNQAIHFRVTVLEAAMSPDCLGPPPK